MKLNQSASMASLHTLSLHDLQQRVTELLQAEIVGLAAVDAMLDEVKQRQKTAKDQEAVLIEALAADLRAAKEVARLRALSLKDLESEVLDFIRQSDFQQPVYAQLSSEIQTRLLEATGDEKLGALSRLQTILDQRKATSDEVRDVFARMRGHIDDDFGGDGGGGCCMCSVPDAAEESN